jgi:hypothetical protein
VVACTLLLITGCSGTSQLSTTVDKELGAVSDKDLSNLPVGAQQTISGGPGVLWGDEKVKLNANFAEVGNLQTLSGVAAAATNLGTFTGVTIADSSTIKASLQSLETSVELKQPLDADLTDLADGSLTGTKVGFADTDNVFTGTNLQAAIEELNDSINAGVPNGTGAKVHWSQLLGVPAGFADGTDDGAGGGDMVYPGAGIPLSTGSAWGTSYSLDIDLTTVSASDDTIPSAKATKALYDSLPVLNFGNGLTETAGTVDVNANVLQRQENFVVKTPVDADDFLLFKAQQAITITDIHVITIGGTSIAVDIQECDSAGANCVTVDAAITATTSGAEDDGTLTNGVIDAGDWLKVVLAAPSGTVDFLTGSIYYTIAE